MKNVQKQKQFIEMLRRAANSPWNREALEALIFHGMCLCFRADQVMNNIKMYSGLHPLSHHRIRVSHGLSKVAAY